jgi:hypothetical protein
LLVALSCKKRGVCPILQSATHVRDRRTFAR